MRSYNAQHDAIPGADPGGGGPGGQDPPFWGTPKLHKEGKNGAKTPRFST